MRTALSLSRNAPSKASAGLSCQQGQRARSRLLWGHQGAFKLQLTAFVRSQAGLLQWLNRAAKHACALRCAFHAATLRRTAVGLNVLPP